VIDECCVLEDSRYLMNIQVIIRNDIHYIRFKKTGTESSCLCRTKLTVLWDTLELLVTQVVLHRLMQHSYQHIFTHEHKDPYVLALYISVELEFCGTVCPQGLYYRCKFLCFQKKQLCGRRYRCLWHTGFLW